VTTPQTTQHQQSAWLDRLLRRKKVAGPLPRPSLGSISVGTRGGLPGLSWSQEVASNLTEQNVEARETIRLVGWILAVSIPGGYLGGGRDGAALAFAVAVLISVGLLKRDSPELKEIQRRREVTPVGCQQDCEAFIAEHEGELCFWLARGDLSKGPLTVVSIVPWESFGNFEEGSRQHWFKKRGAPNGPSDWPDWGVIIIQTSKNGVVCVAETLSNNAWLTSLLGHLQETFIVPRSAALKAFKKTKQGDRFANYDPSQAETPKKPF
jgi:hypothetical protein